jgi:hypothetical protein
MTDDIGNHGGEPDELTRLLRERVTRHTAPATLRAAVTETLSPSQGHRPRWLWLPPALSALATAMVMLLWLMPALPRSGGDPLQLLSRAVMTEHARAVLWGEAHPDAVPGALPRVMEESGVLLNWVFTGDQDLRLVNAQPTFLEGRRALALTYQDRDGHSVSYIVARGPNVAIPDLGRVQISKWRPLVTKDNGFAMIVWKQSGLVCVMVSDLVSDDDLNRFKDYFVKVRSATELRSY